MITLRSPFTKLWLKLILVGGMLVMLQPAAYAQEARRPISVMEAQTYSQELPDLKFFNQLDWDTVTFTADMNTSYFGIQLLKRKPMKDCSFFQNIPLDVSVWYWDGSYTPEGKLFYQDGTGKGGVYICHAFMSTDPEFMASLTALNN